MPRARYLRISALTAALLLLATLVQPNEVRHLKLDEAVHLALAQNRSLKLARLKIEENQHKKEGARSDYYPVLTNQSNILHISELQDLSLPQGSLGTSGGIPIPEQTAVIRQGNNTLYSSGTQLTQPLTQLLRIHQENRVAAVETATSRSDLKAAENEVALQVHALYFGILVAQLQKSAAEQETSFATETLHENENDVRNGSALQVATLQSRAELLQGQQSVLTAELQIDDFTAELNDLLGLPLDTKLDLDPDVATDLQTQSKDEYLKAAWEENPEIRAAQLAIEKAHAGVSVAKTAYIPDVTAYARYSYQDGIPFFVRNFGTVGVNINYTLWDFGKRKSAVQERDTQLREAEVNLERLKEKVAVEVERSYNKLERTKSMVNVAKQVAELRAESERLANEQAGQGVVLPSDVRHATAATYKAKADLLQASLGYVLAFAELERAVGRAPGLP
jgi:outer membrane protein TolC